MRWLYPVLFLLLTAPAALAGKRREQDLLATARSLDRALEAKDSITLKRLLHPQLGYGHSNGWIETREEVIADLYNGKLTYNSIKGSEPKVVMEGATGLLRNEVTVDIIYNGKPLVMTLRVLQVWVYKKGNWILLGRQSVTAG